MKTIKLNALVFVAVLTLNCSVASAPDSPKAPDVLARHFAAVGGEKALEGIHSILIKASGEEGTSAFHCELTVKRPGRILLELSANGTLIREGRDSRGRCWRQDPDGVHELTGSSPGEMMDLAIGFFAPGQLFWKEALAGAPCQEERDLDRPVVVLGKKSSAFPVLAFERQSGLLIKVGSCQFDQYRPVQGIKVPFSAAAKDIRFRVQEVVLNPPAPDAIFERPDRDKLSAQEPAPALQFETRLSQTGKLEVVRRPAAADYGRAALSSLPRFDASRGQTWQVDLRGYDLRQLDLSGRLNDLLHADFDHRTRWPEKAPAGFDRARILALGVNPGLRVRQLHDRGITGQGIGVGIIDQSLLVDHAEYGDRLRLYEEVHLPANSPAQMHGPAVASIAVGRTVGVAPGAELYYIAEMHGTMGAGREFQWDFAPLAQSIHRLLDVNATLPAGRKMRVISISVGWSPTQKGYAEAMAAVKRASKEGVFVISTALEDTHHLAFHGLGRDALADPDDFASYGPGSWWAKQFWGGAGRFEPSRRLLVPMDARCTASPTGPNEYVFYSSGGWSWSVPWVAGFYALACQVKPEITPEQFWALALQTGRTVHLRHEGEELEFGSIADPVALIAALESGSQARVDR